MKHINNGKCPKCQSIIDRYPGFHSGLRAWFEDLQKRHPEAHISCAGRGKDEQEMLFHRKATRALFGKSAHNFNAALDLFENQGNPSDIYEENWFRAVIGSQLPSWLEWYGRKGARFPELPHVEVKNWKDLVDEGKLFLVEKLEVDDVA